MMMRADAQREDFLRDLTEGAVGRLRTRGAVARPDGSAANLACLSWATRLELVSDARSRAKLSEIGCGTFAAYSYPSASSALVQLAADLVTWLFLFDDRYCEDPDANESELHRFFGKFERIVLGESPLASLPFEAALSDLRDRASDLGADRPWMERFAHDMAHYFEGCVQEIPFRRSMKFPSVAEYRAVRLQSIGARPVFDLIELDSRSFLHDAPEATDVVQRDRLDRVRDIASLLFAWVNDIYSYRKESSAGDPLNLVAVLRHQFDLSDAEAFEAAVDIFNLELSELEALSADVRTRGASPGVERYLTGLDDWIHGNLAWCSSCLRYR